jgi:chemotaxis protein MotB
MIVARTASLILAAFAVLAFAMGCQNKVHDENIALHHQNRELQAQLSEKEDRLRAAPDPAQLASMQKEISDRDARIRELEASLKKPAAGAAADPALAGIETTYDPKAGTLTVNLPGDVLFDAGQATLKASALGTLDKVVGAIRKDYAGKLVRVDGFTDADPISRTKNQWDDNWDLSYARAKSVMQYITAHGVDAAKVSIAANGANKPKASKPASRRVEIVVLTK